MPSCSNAKFLQSVAPIWLVRCLNRARISEGAARFQQLADIFAPKAGIVVIHDHDERLLQAADAAMVQARACGPNHLQLYSEALGRRTAENLALQQDLRHALERGEFLLHYQPRADLASGRITGFEALLRWNRPGRGMVDPAHFIPLLEESGLIVPVGEWVIRQACAQLQQWLESGVRAVPVAVNVSARQFRQRQAVGEP